MKPSLSTLLYRIENAPDNDYKSVAESIIENWWEDSKRLDLDVYGSFMKRLVLMKFDEICWWIEFYMQAKTAELSFDDPQLRKDVEKLDGIMDILRDLQSELEEMMNV